MSPFLLGGLMVLCACAHRDTSIDASRTEAPHTLSLEDFSDGTWSLHVDRRLVTGALGISHPTQTLSEKDYEPSDTAPTYRVSISERGTKASIGDEPWAGARSTADGDTIHFDLSQGTFAGGRFLVWSDKLGLQAELTLFGSGVPIVQSERGKLTRDTVNADP